MSALRSVAAAVESALRHVQGGQDRARAAVAALAAFEQRLDELEGRVAALARSIAMTLVIGGLGVLVNTAVAITAFAS